MAISWHFTQSALSPVTPCGMAGAAAGEPAVTGVLAETAQANAQAARISATTTRPTTAETTLCVISSPQTMSKRSVCTWSRGTPICGSAFSIASMSAFGPQMKYWKRVSRRSGRCRFRMSALM